MLLRIVFSVLAVLITETVALRCANNDTGTPQLGLPAGIEARQVVNQTVDVYFHIASTEANANRITEQIVADQWTVLHDAYIQYGFILNLINTSWIVDDIAGKGFYNNQSQIEDYDAYIAFLNTTRHGGYDSLNMYFFSDLLPSLGGQCNLPSPISSGEALVTDGCIINGDTMPGLSARDGSDTAPPQGHIAIHEAGHWFGLLHTFNGRACDSINDYVADTPAQAGFSEGCPIGRDSCPDLEGEDPIHNFMDYSDDSCTTEFTPGQYDRMHQQFDVYRRS